MCDIMNLYFKRECPTLKTSKDQQKIILIGDGAVGSSYAYSLINQNIGQELGIIDVNREKAEGDVMDLSSALAFTAPMKLYVADYKDCGDADLIVYTAGASQKPGESRLDLTEKNLRITKSVVESVMASGFNGIFLVATNPVDILSYAVYKWSGLPAEQVLGTGTSLDSARFRQAIANLLDVDVRNVHGYIIGEHGDTEFPVWSHANVAGLQINEWVENNPNTDEQALVEIFFSVRDAAYTIIEKKGATFYGIGVSLARITKAILNNEHAVLPLSVYLEGQYGEEEIYLGTPAIINRNGLKKIIEIPLNDSEKEKMKHSANTIRTHLSEVLERCPDLSFDN